jgi:hypothetical protein
MSRVVHLITVAAAIMAMLCFAGAAAATRTQVASQAVQASQAVSLSLDVYFDFSGNITVTLPDGTPVGTTSGTPTTIPAGFYTISLTQPGCVDIPYFDLNGPGVNIQDNLSGGEVTSLQDDADFQPNSTYTWKNDNNRAIVYTFTTSSQVLGTPPPPASAVLKTATHGPIPAKNRLSNSGVVGSDVIPFRGTLDAKLSSSGRLSLAYKGKAVTKLAAGRYTIKVADTSSTGGLTVEKTKGRLKNITGSQYRGTHSASLDLTAGRWRFATRPAGTAFTILVG